MRSDRERLLDIQEAIDKIEQHTSSDIDAFADDEMQQVWVIQPRLELAHKPAQRATKSLQ